MYQTLKRWRFWQVTPIVTLGKSKRRIIRLSFAELAQIVVKVNVIVDVGLISYVRFFVVGLVFHLPIFDVFTVTTVGAISGDDKRMIFVLFSPENRNRLWPFNLHERAQPIFWEASWKQAYIILTPLNPTFIWKKLGFTGVYIIFLISAQKHRLWVLVRTASMFWAEI